MDAVGDDVRRSLDAARARLAAHAEDMKDAGGEVAALARVIEAMSPTDRVAAEELLAEWALSVDKGVQWDGLVLIRTLHVTSALPTLRLLAERLEAASDALAPYDWAWVNGIIAELVTATP